MNSLTLRADAPIETPEEDFLGFQPFASALASGLVQRAPTEGFVVGLQARWGMGKTSAVNLCLAAIREIETTLPAHRKTTIQAFNPWFFSGVDALTNGYLSLLQDAIDRALPSNRRGWIDRGREWAKRVRKRVSKHADPIGSSVAGAFTILSGGAAAPLSGALKGSIIASLKESQNVVLARRFAELLGRLSAMESRVLIIVDDLDRLQPADLRQVLALIKTFGNLPHVTHLLVYDREIVDAALAEGLPDRTERRLPSYREKIVQAEFDLPSATQAGLRRLISRQVDPLIKDEPEFDQMDWYYSLSLALAFYLRTPRDLVRFTNGLTTVWPSVAGEAYFPDLFVIELLRLFERDLYEGIRDHRSTLVGDYEALADKDEQAKIVEAILKRVPDLRRPHIVRVLQRLFPRTKGFMASNVYGWGHSDIRDHWRVGSPAGFDVYFRMSPPEGEYSKAEVARLAKAATDARELEAAFHDARSRTTPEGSGTFIPKLLDLLMELTDPDRPQVPQEPLLTVLLAQGEMILASASSEPAMSWWHGRPEISGIVDRLLRVMSPAERLPALRKALDGAGLSTRSVVIASQFEPHNKDLPADVRSRLAPSMLSPEEARDLVEDLVSEIEADPDRIISAPVFWQPITLWNAVRGPAPIKVWIDEHIHDPQMVVLLVDMVMARVRSSAGETRELRGPITWAFFDLRQVYEAAQQCVSTQAVRDDDCKLLLSFIRDAEERLSIEAEEPGEGEDDGRVHDDV